MRSTLATIGILVLAGAAFCGCRTVYDDTVVRMHDPGKGRSSDAVISMPVEREGALRSSHYRYACALPKAELDRVIAAMEQYLLEIFKALGPKREKLPEYADVFIAEDEASFRQALINAPDAVVDSDFVAVIPSRRKLVVLHRGRWKEFRRRLFRAQARLFFGDVMGQLPVWLEEGMVSFFEEVIIGGRGAETTFKIVGYSGKKLAGVQALMKSGTFPGLASLMAITKREKLSEADRLTAWAFVYWSQHSGRRSQTAFKRYVRALKDNKPDNVDIEEYLHMTVADFEKRWKEWLLRQEVYLKKGSLEQ